MRVVRWLAFCGMLGGLVCFGQGTTGSADARTMEALRQGSAAMHRGDAAGAEIEFRKAVEAGPASADAYFGLGLADLRLTKVEDAEQALGKAVALNPGLTGAHLFLGIAEYQMHRLGDAEAAVELEVKAQPDNVEALSWLGIIALGSGDADKAAVVLDRAAALSPKDANLLYYRGRAHAQVAQEAYQQLFKLDPDSWLVHRALGESLADSGQPDKAVGEFEAAVKKQPGNPDLYEALGEAYQKLSRFDEAIKAYRQQVTLHPNNPVALYNLGKIEVERGTPEEGVRYLRQAIGAHAESAAAYFYLGTGLAAMGSNEEAVGWLEKALASKPSPFIEESDEYELVRVYQKLGRKEDAGKAAEALKRFKGASSPGKGDG